MNTGSLQLLGPSAARRRPRLAGVVRALVCTVVGMLAHSHAGAAMPPRPADGDPKWQRIVSLSDGRKLVSDGAMALDSTLVKPAELPANVQPFVSPIVEKQLHAEAPDEFRLSQLKSGPRPQSYTAPSGVILAARYIDYLRRTVPEGKLRLRMKGPIDPVVLVLDGKPVGLLMPLHPGTDVRPSSGG